MKISAMPDGYALFGNEHLADLTAILITLKQSALHQKQPEATKNSLWFIMDGEFVAKWEHAGRTPTTDVSH